MKKNKKIRECLESDWYKREDKKNRKAIKNCLYGGIAIGILIGFILANIIK